MSKYQLVPTEATPEMLGADLHPDDDTAIRRSLRAALYHSMLSASPSHGDVVGLVRELTDALSACYHNRPEPDGCELCAVQAKARAFLQSIGELK